MAFNHHADLNPHQQYRIKKLKRDNPRAIGIQDLCYEIQQMCLNLHNRKYCISFAFLLRSLLEQGSIYFLINKNRWDKLKEGYEYETIQEKK